MIIIDLTNHLLDIHYYNTGSTYGDLREYTSMLNTWLYDNVSTSDELGWHGNFYWSASIYIVIGKTHMSSAIWFANDSDAIIFKLRWGV